MRMAVSAANLTELTLSVPPPFFSSKKPKNKTTYMYIQEHEYDNYDGMHVHVHVHVAIVHVVFTQ